MTLSSKRRDGRLFVVDNVGGAVSHRTKDFLSALQQLAEATDATLDSKSTTFVTDPEECSPEFERAIHNVKHVQWLSPQVRIAGCVIHCCSRGLGGKRSYVFVCPGRLPPYSVPTYWILSEESIWC